MADGRLGVNTEAREVSKSMINVREPMTLDNTAKQLLFTQARSQNGWMSKSVSDEQLRALYDLMKWGPTSVNSCPARVLFLRTKQSKERLASALNPGNVEKTMTAPVTALIGYETEFYKQLPRLFPHNPAIADLFSGEAKREFAEVTAFRNGSIQGAYLIVAARAVGLDCGPMSGFDNAKVDVEFFAGTSIKSNFLCNLGYGDPEKVFSRSPRLPFEDACKVL